MSLKNLMLNDLDSIFKDGFDFTDKASHNFGELDEFLNVIFDEEYEAVFENKGYETTSVVPCFIIPTVKASNISSQSSFVINTQVFGVVDIQKENSDITRVILDIR